MLRVRLMGLQFRDVEEGDNEKPLPMMPHLTLVGSSPHQEAGTLQSAMHVVGTSHRGCPVCEMVKGDPGSTTSGVSRNSVGTLIGCPDGQA